LSIVLLAGAGGILWWNNATFSAAGHHHGSVSAAVGEPGNALLPARTIEVAMVEDNGAMKFVPSSIEVAKGDQVHFRITNRGMLEHEFILATLSENMQHLEEMKQTPGMVHSGANSVTLKPDESGEIFWHFTNAGNFDFSCLIPGHRESGMHGSVVVN